MKTIGLVGGMSWESTLIYYKLMNEKIKKECGDTHSVKCILYSFDFDEVEKKQHLNKWDELRDMMVDAAVKLKKAGSDFIVICSNTMHQFAADIEIIADIEVLHIAYATGKEIVKLGIQQVGLLGKKYTMQGEFYKNYLEEQFNIKVIIPSDASCNIIHDVIYKELIKGTIHEKSRNMYLDIISSLAKRGAEGVILGCTEIPMLIESHELPLFDTTKIHAEAAVIHALKQEKVNVI